MDKPDVSSEEAATSAGAADTEHARRASSFGAAARAYAQHRPDYPIAAINWVLEPVVGASGGSGPLAMPATAADRQVRILDIGAGTGKLTASLVNLQVRGKPPGVIAVEPDPEMLAELRARLPDVPAMRGRAEAIPLPDGSVDAVLAGQAAHWFDLDRAIPEIARVLVPGGVLAGLWNADDDRAPWVADLHRAAGGRTMASFSAFAAHRDDDELTRWLRADDQLFWPPELRGFENSQLRTADSLIETLRTHSAFLIMDPAEREAVLANVQAFLSATPETTVGEFSFPIYTLALRAIRR